MPALAISAVAIRREAAEAPEEDVTEPGYGWVMFFVFSAAVLAISFAVAALALVPTWWMLGVVFGAHLVLTAVTTKVVLDAFKKGTHGDSEPAAGVPAASPAALSPLAADLGSPEASLAPSR